MYFFDNGNILIPSRYQLHPASATTKCLELVETSRMHTAIRKIKKKRKSHVEPSAKQQELPPPGPHSNCKKGSPRTTPPRRYTIIVRS
jgi:hypothetical protein